MSALTLQKIRFRSGTWEGRIENAPTSGARPQIIVRYLDREVSGVTLKEAEAPGCWALTIPVPIEAVSEGVQSFVIIDADANVKLGDFTLIAGEPLADDLRAEVELLRAELDMLKRAFRRHCLETT
ncbi:hypothetical protein [Tritonibacter mobilis]|uniref:hypothetical protein n=1 Tax=Tritonibacter mobilis TaxID=379347 RepID=UPI00080696D5|nr:hypothetical protein [Tritonibacter mobilis]MBU3032946.1 hypothetical protein [Tritonibacter mobilis]WHQ82133.1 hypothetical protein OMR53_13115 [Tritonibacter mobilis]